MSYKSNTEPHCICKGIDWERECPVCGPLIDRKKTERSPLDEIWEMVERMFYDGRITWTQRGLFLWAARKAREVESPERRGQSAQSIDGVEEL
jgi:hypothetical protein